MTPCWPSISWPLIHYFLNFSSNWTGIRFRHFVNGRAGETSCHFVNNAPS
jgi:hypothetical protein